MPDIRSNIQHCSFCHFRVAGIALSVIFLLAASGFLGKFTVEKTILNFLGSRTDSNYSVCAIVSLFLLSAFLAVQSSFSANGRRAQQKKV